MARFTAAAAVTVSSHWAAGEFVRFDYFRDEIGQNLEYLMQSHAHDGATVASGATLAAANPLFVWFLTPPLGAAFI